MIDFNYTNNLNKPNFHFHRNCERFDSVFMEYKTAGMIRNIWSGDSSLMQSARATTPWVVRKYKWSGKVARIKELVMSGKYKVDAEKLAEKILGNMVDLLMAN